MALRQSSLAGDGAGRPGVAARAEGNRRILDLAPVRDRLGEHWPRYSEAVRLIAEKVIRKEIGAADRYERSGDSFVIAFGDSGGLRVERSFAKIQRTLEEMLYGSGIDADSERARPAARGTAARGAPRKGLFRRMIEGIARPFRSIRLFGGARRPAAPAPVADAVAEDRGVAVSEASAAAAAPPGPAAVAARRVAAAAAPSGADGSPQAVAAGPVAAADSPHSPSGPARSQGRDGAHAASHRAAHGGGMMARLAAKNDAEIRKLEGAILAAALRTAREHASLPANVEAALTKVRFAYRPIWVVNGRLVGVYRCTPVAFEDGTFVEGDAILPNATSREQRVMLDQLTLANVILDIEALVRQKRDVLIVIPLHFGSFVEEWSDKVLVNLCQHIPEAGRPRIVIEILDAAEGRSDPRLQSAMRTMKPFAGRFSADLAVTNRDFRFWREAGFTASGVNAAENARPEDELIAELDQFQLFAKREGLRTFVTGLKTRSLILAAATMGFDFVHGDPIAPLAAGGGFDRVEFDFGNLYAEDLLGT
ncbi:MAG TPA: hypothetical protein VGB90_04720 [Alphaproteobacteria bacterium]